METSTVNGEINEIHAACNMLAKLCGTGTRGKL